MPIVHSDDVGRNKANVTATCFNRNAVAVKYLQQQQQKAVGNLNQSAIFSLALFMFVLHGLG